VAFIPCLVRSCGAADREQVHLGHPLLDSFLEFIAGRARWNTVLATAFDLKVFFSIIDTDPAEVTTADVLAFIKRQRPLLVRFLPTLTRARAAGQPGQPPDRPVSPGPGPVLMT